MIDLGGGYPKINELDATPSVPFEAKGIIHYLLNTRGHEPLEFGAQRIDTSGAGSDIEAYVRSLPIALLERADSPFDVPLCEEKGDIAQKWILIQLGKTVDWCFTPETMGVTSKDKLGGDLFGVGWLDCQNQIRADLIDKDYEGCTFVWFGLAKMAAAPSKDVPSRIPLNYHITLMQGDKRMPTIFDPDVRNPGGKIPP